jgi:mRNA-degrading endonuclease RelE of RelBE toxin-antitoxin system
VIYRRIGQFKRAYDQLPKEIQEKVIKAFELFKENSRHPSLVVKKVKGTNDIWEGRIDRFYRFTFQYIDNPTYNPERDNDAQKTICLFRNIGRHEIVSIAP